MSVLFVRKEVRLRQVFDRQADRVDVELLLHELAAKVARRQRAHGQRAMSGIEAFFQRLIHVTSSFSSAAARARAVMLAQARARLVAASWDPFSFQTGQ